MEDRRNTHLIHFSYYNYYESLRVPKTPRITVNIIKDNLIRNFQLLPTTTNDNGDTILDESLQFYYVYPGIKRNGDTNEVREYLTDDNIMDMINKKAVCHIVHSQFESDMFQVHEAEIEMAEKVMSTCDDFLQSEESLKDMNAYIEEYFNSVDKVSEEITSFLSAEFKSFVVDTTSKLLHTQPNNNNDDERSNPLTSLTKPQQTITDIKCVFCKDKYFTRKVYACPECGYDYAICETCKFRFRKEYYGHNTKHVFCEVQDKQMFYTKPTYNHYEALLKRVAKVEANPLYYHPNEQKYKASATYQKHMRLNYLDRHNYHTKPITIKFTNEGTMTWDTMFRVAYFSAQIRNTISQRFDIYFDKPVAPGESVEVNVELPESFKDKNVGVYTLLCGVIGGFNYKRFIKGSFVQIELEVVVETLDYEQQELLPEDN